jgi:ethanolamine ammonia-lyase large subunit
VVYRSTIRGERFTFESLHGLLAAANEVKSGDELAGIAARDERERVAAKLALADLPLADLVAEPLVDDEVTAAVSTPSNPHHFAQISSLTVGELRERVLHPDFAAEWSKGLSAAITPEIAAACAKLMSNLDLVAAAAPLHVITRCRNTMGEPGVLGVRAQPNHPTDDVQGILLSALDGIGMGCGDAMLGVNPVNEAVGPVAAILHGLHELIAALGAPTQTSVLAHITTQLAALDAGAPVDLLFQSVAGTEAANRAFGIDLALLAHGREQVLAHHRTRQGEFVGEQVMYFETGQGSALSAEAHHGIDQLTIEARAQAVARLYDPFLINSVVGFIGPEYLADATQITRAGLEDHFVGKLMGLPVGVDVCYTNHAAADQNSNDALLVLLAAAGCGYVMGVPGGDDVMLNYQTTSYHDVATVRRTLGLRPAPAFEAWLTESGLWQNGAPAPAGSSPWPTTLPELDAAGFAGRPVRELLAEAAR